MRLVHYFGLLLMFTSLGKLSFAQTTAADDCASAIYLTIQDEFCAGQEFESDNHTLSGGDPVPSCWDAPPQNTMWFRFIPDSTSVAISTNFSSDVSETQIAVYSGSCGSLTEIGCEDDISQTNFKSRVQVNNLIPGATYYILVDTEGENGSYFICVQNKIAPGDPDEIQARMGKISTERSGTQPVKSRTGGSTFKNTDTARAWELIDQAGCRGLVIGDAQVSEQHCNFLINRGNATADDLETLGDTVRQRVMEASGVELHWEIRRIGKPQEGRK